MMSCVGGSRSRSRSRCSIPHNNIQSAFPLPLSTPNSIANICRFLSNRTDSNSIVKKRRTRRGRPQPRDSCAKAFYTVYPRIFPHEGEGKGEGDGDSDGDDYGDFCPLLKIEPRSPAEKTEFLQELPALLSRLREAEKELPLILSNFGFNPVDYPSPSASASASASPSPSQPSLVDEGKEEEEEEKSYSFVEASDIEGGMDTILALASPSPSLSPSAIHLPELQCHHPHPHPTSYMSAIRGLRRRLDGQMRPAGNKIIKEIEGMNGDMSFWLKRGEAWAEAEAEAGAEAWTRTPHKLSLKLDYEQVVSAWCGRGSLYIEEGDQCPGPDIGSDDVQVDYDSGSHAIDIGLVPDNDVSLIWKGTAKEEKEEEEEVVEDSNFNMNNSMREARVLRYRQKRQTRLFSKKIRYQVRKLNAEKRPRMKTQREEGRKRVCLYDK